MCGQQSTDERLNLSNKQTEVEEGSGASDMKDSPPTKSTCVSLLTKELYLELLIIHHRASLQLLLLNAG